MEALVSRTRISATPTNSHDCEDYSAPPSGIQTAHVDYGEKSFQWRPRHNCSSVGYCVPLCHKALGPSAH